MGEIEEPQQMDPQEYDTIKPQEGEMPMPDENGEMPMPMPDENGEMPMEGPPPGVRLIIKPSWVTNLCWRCLGNAVFVISRRPLHIIGQGSSHTCTVAFSVERRCSSIASWRVWILWMEISLIFLSGDGSLRSGA